MFKRENEEEEKYSRPQQQHKMRGTPHQYGQPQHQQYRQYGTDAPTSTPSSENFGPANIRMRHFQQQQHKMHHMQNVNSHKPQYHKTVSSLSSIPEIHHKSPTSNQQFDVANTSSNPASDERLPEDTKLFDQLVTGYDTQDKYNVEEVKDAEPISVSNVMEDLINVAESVVAASKQCTNTSFDELEDAAIKEDLENDPSKSNYKYNYILFFCPAQRLFKYYT